jgi:FtsH-binding integral membrane protein
VITPNGSGNASSVTVTIAASAPAASSSIARHSEEHRGTPSVFYALAFFGMGSLFGLARRLRRKGSLVSLLLLAALLSVSAGSLLGCGVSPQDASATESATPLSTSRVTVSAIAGTVQQTVSFVLTIQGK